MSKTLLEIIGTTGEPDIITQIIDNINPLKLATMKEYLKCTITTKDGLTFTNPLKLSEIKLLPQILKENKKVTIERQECTPAYYKATFGH